MSSKVASAYQARYRELAERVAEVGFISAGTHPPLPALRHRELPLPRRSAPTHGPYHQWTAKVNGKTVTRRLTETEAGLYQQWIANDRQLRALIAQIRQIAAKATELIMKETAGK